MAPVCFRTCRVRRFLDDIYTSAAYYGKKEGEVVQQFGATEARERKQTVKKIGRGRYKQYQKKKANR
jgi:hypothetical protein